VGSLTQHGLGSESTVSDRPQRMPEDHTWPVDRTAERADNGRPNVIDGVLTPCPRPERSGMTGDFDRQIRWFLDV